MALFKNKKTALVAVAILVLAGLIWAAHGLFAGNGNVDVRWPTTSQTHTLLLRPAGSAESMRFVDYGPDHITVNGMRIEYRDGRTALVTYRDGKATAISEYFAEDPQSSPPAGGGGAAAKPAPLVALKSLSDGLKQRHLSSLVELKSDGATIKSLTKFRPDGNFAAMGVRDAADNFVVTIYGADGTADVASVAVFDGSSGALKSEQEFRADGSLAATFSTQVEGGPQARRTEFDTNGNKTREVVFNSDYDIAVNEYASDGKTLVKKTEFGYSGVTVTSYDAAGAAPVVERTYTDDTHISVRYFDRSGVATIKQIWVKLDTSAVPADRVGVVNDGFTLDEVYEYYNDGSSTKVDVNFFPGGKVVKEWLMRTTTEYRPSTDKHFRDDGSLDYTDQCPPTSEGWTCKTDKMPDGPNKARVTLPADYFKVVPLLPAPKAEKPVIPKIPLTVDLN